MTNHPGRKPPAWVSHAQAAADKRIAATAWPDGPDLPALCADLPPATPAAVRALREGAGLSLAEAAVLIGIGDRGTWARWERGERDMPVQAWALALLALQQHPRWVVAPAR